MSTGLLAGAVTVKFDSDTSGFEKGSNVVQEKSNSLQSVFKGLGIAAVAGFTALTVSLGSLGKTAIDQAGKFEMYEATLKTMLGTQEAATARMKEYSDFAKSTPFELPQIVELGNQLQALGKYSKENMSNLGDLAAASGKPIEQVTAAFAKLSTGQKGIAVDMFRDLLITTDDWVKATGKGISKSGELMASTEEMLAVLPKILADKKFIGMMDQQSQTFVGKMSNLADTWNTKLREFGDKLLPYIKPALDGLIDLIGKIDVDYIFTSFKNLYNLIFKGDYTGGFFGLGSNEDSKIITAFFDIKDAVGAIWDALNGKDIGEGSTYGTVLGFFVDVAYAIHDLPAALSNFWDALTGKDIGEAGTYTGIIATFTDLGYKIFDVWTAITNFLQPELDLLKQTWDAIWGALQGLMIPLGVLAGSLMFLGANIISFLIYMFNQLRPVFDQIWQAIINLWNSLQPVIQTLVALAGIIIAVLTPVLQIWWAYIVQVAKGIGEQIAGLINIFSGLIDFLVGVFTGNWDKAFSGLRRIWDGFLQVLKGAWDLIKAPIQAIIDGIVNFFKGIDLFRMGIDMIQGFINGIKNMAGSVVSTVTGAVSGAIDAAKRMLGIHSPSRVFMEIGMYTAEGYIDGVDKMQSDVEKQISDMSYGAITTAEMQMGVTNAITTKERPIQINHYGNFLGTKKDQRQFLDGIMDELLLVTQ